MNGIKLTKDSWHRKFYEMWWVKEAPNNLCNYFWGLLLAIVTSPLIAGRALYEIFQENPGFTGNITKTFYYIFNTALAAVIGGLLGFVLGKAFFNPILSLAIVGGIALGLMFIFLFVHALVSIEKSETVNMAKEAVKAKKNKICPQIEWKN